MARRDANGTRHLLGHCDIDPAYFVWFTRRQQVAGFCYAVLAEMNLLDLLDTSSANTMKFAYIGQWGKNRRLIQAAIELQRCLDRAGIDTIHLKGPLFAERYYGQADRRTVADIDVLVQHWNIEESDALLRTVGYQRKSSILVDRRLTMFFTHHFEYLRGNIKVELHWSLARHVGFKLNYAPIWGGTVTAEHDGWSFRVLCDEYELVVQILTIFKDIELRAIKAKSLVDTYVLLKACHRRVCWDDFFDRRQEEGLLHISLNVFDLVLSVLDCHREFSELSTRVGAEEHLVSVSTLEDKIDLLFGKNLLLRNQLWGISLYSIPRWKSLTWWFVSLPFRLSVYRKA